MATSLFQAPPIAPFNVEDPNNIGIRWERWTKRLETYITATGLTEDKQKRSLLLFCAGEAVHEIFDNLPDSEEAKDYKTALKLLTDYFSPKKNKTFEIYKFRQAQQLDSESVDKFYTRLRQLVSTCEFTNTDDEIRSQIIQRCSSKKLRENALRDDNITLAKLLEHARALENSTKQALDMEKGMDNSTQELATLRINEDENRRNRRNESHNTTCRS